MPAELFEFMVGCIAMIKAACKEGYKPLKLFPRKAGLHQCRVEFNAQELETLTWPLLLLLGQRETQLQCGPPELCPRSFRVRLTVSCRGNIQPVIEIMQEVAQGGMAVR
jgi:hypothetical protein